MIMKVIGTCCFNTKANIKSDFGISPYSHTRFYQMHAVLADVQNCTFCVRHRFFGKSTIFQLVESFRIVKENQLKVSAKWFDE